MELGAIKAIYPIFGRRAMVSEKEIMSEDPRRWVQVPFDYLIQSESFIDVSSEDITLIVETQNDDESWPRDKPHDNESWRDNIQCGDILDVKGLHF